MIHVDRSPSHAPLVTERPASAPPADGETRSDRAVGAYLEVPPVYRPVKPKA